MYPGTRRIPLGGRPTMNPLSMELIVTLLILIGVAAADFLPQGKKCKEKQCSVDEYCSEYDDQCKPCVTLCKKKPSECIELCKEYIVHSLFVLQKEHEDFQTNTVHNLTVLQKQQEDFRREIGRLQILVEVSIAVAVLASLSTFYLLLRKSDRWKKMRAGLRRLFVGKKLKKTQENAELGMVKHNGLKIPMPTISASVAPARLSENGSGNASGSRSGSGSGNGNATPNTTTTNLSTRHPSEDTTLDYAYDNPAMTPSPETVQLRAKRESSF
ncbi:uncharacterized protein LOC108623289 isoform X2 [Ceratina calcarata]|uniref:Uncharacterized protein LOC108623289 isoform X2 n=1 Tax=Ceratina calcarata TaxID=156304 RepID=A0AAJ7W9B1_9HYME|nr:uncharacterized protein LOC108623289 isoform X2 [Ceratina calcarata]